VLSVAGTDLSTADQELLASAKRKMLGERARRVRPHLDDKILASWNGLMLGAMARASAVLGESRYRGAAEKNLMFLKAKLWDAASGVLHHRWRDGECDTVQLLEAYAFLLAGVMEIYEATIEPEHLDFALRLADGLLKRFYDTQQGGFWQTTAADVILRMKSDYDGAEPSGNSVACLAFLKLGRIAGRNDLIEAAQKTLQSFSSRLQLPQAVPVLLQALDYSLTEPMRVVVAGDSKQPDIRMLLGAIHSVYQPNKVVLGNQGSVEPFARTLPTQAKPVAYVCTGTACQAPTADPGRIKELLKGKAG
jgi:uncharacterized protein YyaL (SSP411 family)